MTNEQRQYLMNKIREELSGIDAEIAELEDVTRPISPENAIGRVSRMDALGNKMVNEQVLASARERKLKLETALGKADSPEFGLCMACMQPISPERFLAIPEAVLCVKCAGR